MSAPTPAVLPSPSAIKPVPHAKTVKDNFPRTYSIDFMSFYPKLHSALHDYAGRNKGNSFQVVRIGSDAVIFRGRYKAKGDQERFLMVITAKPVESKKTLMEVKISPINPEVSTANLEKAANAIFQIFEKEINLGR